MKYFNLDQISNIEWYVIGYIISLIRFSWLVIGKKNIRGNKKTNIFRFIILLFLCWLYPFYIFLYIINLIMKLVIFIINFIKK